MPGGRPAKPTKLKLLHGDDKKNPARVNRKEPVPSTSPVAPPVELTDEARKVWDQLAPELEMKGVLTAWDVVLFGFFCEAVVMATQGVAAARYGEAKPGAPSPMSQFKDAVAICSTLGGRFGLTPADRQKLIIGKDDDGAKEDLLSG